MSVIGKLGASRVSLVKVDGKEELEVGNEKLSAQGAQVSDANVFDVGGSQVVSWKENEKQMWAAKTADGALTAPKEVETKIHLRSGDIDPTLLPNPSTPRGLNPHEKQLVLLQLQTQMLPGYQEALKELGVELGSYVSGNAFIARVPASAQEEVLESPYVRGLVSMSVEQRSSEEINAPVNGLVPNNLPTAYDLMVFAPDLKEQVAKAVEVMGGKVNSDLDSGSSLLSVELTPQQLKSLLAASAEITWAEPFHEMEQDVDLARITGGANYVQQVAGYTGKGLRGHVMEGLYDDHPAFAANEFRKAPIAVDDPAPDNHGQATGGIIYAGGSGVPDAEKQAAEFNVAEKLAAEKKAVEMAAAKKIAAEKAAAKAAAKAAQAAEKQPASTEGTVEKAEEKSAQTTEQTATPVASALDEDWVTTWVMGPNGEELPGPHGNEIASTIYGGEGLIKPAPTVAGTVNPRARGIIPDAQAYYTNANAVMNNNKRFELTERLINEHHVMFQTASWGSGRTTEYGARSAEMDDIIFKLDIPITQSQSNAGSRDSRPQAWAKNIISVGAVNHFNNTDSSDDKWAKSGSIGPATDGRIKPDLAFWYDKTFTVDGPAGYTEDFGGTSGATPTVNGHIGIIIQMWTDGIFGNKLPHAKGADADSRFANRPHAMTVKAMAIASAKQWQFNGAGHDLTRVHQGWGMPDLKFLYDNRDKVFAVNEEVALKATETKSYELEVAPNEPVLKISMVYKDPAAAVASKTQRVNDLDLKVTAPDGTVYFGNNGLLENMFSTPGGTANKVDTVENVFVDKPMAGKWKVEVTAAEVNQDSHLQSAEMDADFALVAIGVKREKTSFFKRVVDNVREKAWNAWRTKFDRRSDVEDRDLGFLAGPSTLTLPLVTEESFDRAMDLAWNGDETEIKRLVSSVRQFGKTLVGLAADDAQKRAYEAGVSSRIVMEDGEPLILSADADPVRLSFAVEKGIVVDASASESNW
jgi:hypothetical protein